VSFILCKVPRWKFSALPTHFPPVNGKQVFVIGEMVVLVLCVVGHMGLSVVLNGAHVGLSFVVVHGHLVGVVGFRVVRGRGVECPGHSADAVVVSVTWLIIAIKANISNRPSLSIF